MTNEIVQGLLEVFNFLLNIKSFFSSSEVVVLHNSPSILCKCSYIALLQYLTIFLDGLSCNVTT